LGSFGATNPMIQSQHFKQPSQSRAQASGGMQGGKFVHRALMLLLSISGPVNAAYLCTADGKTTYQDKPCTAAIVAQNTLAREHVLRLQQKLDQLAADGFGRVIPPRRAATPIPPASRPNDEPEYFVGRPRMSRDAREAQIRQSLAEADARTRQKNQESQAQLNEIIERAKHDCGGELQRVPVVGMRDETFRMCTTFAKFTVPYQIVVANEGAVQLRLYLYESRTVERVYSVGGVITAVRP